MEQQNSTYKTDFLIDAYKSRIDFFSDHANRTWTRFHILLTVELAIAGLFFDALFDKGTLSPQLWTLPILGIFVSLLWYILGAQDRCAYLGYREQIHLFEDILIKEIGLDNFPMFNSSGIKRYDLLTWRANPISLSKLIALFPFLFFILWIVAIASLIL